MMSHIEENIVGKHAKGQKTIRTNSLEVASRLIHAWVSPRPGSVELLEISTTDVVLCEQFVMGASFQRVKFIHTKISWNLENLNSTRNPQVR